MMWWWEWNRRIFICMNELGGFLYVEFVVVVDYRLLLSPVAHCARLFTVAL